MGIQATRLLGLGWLLGQGLMTLRAVWGVHVGGVVAEGVDVES